MVVYHQKKRKKKIQQTSNFNYICNSNFYHWMICFAFNVWFGFMVFNLTFNNISVVSSQSFIFGGPGENHRPVADKLYHIMLYTSPWSRFELTTSMVIGTVCIGSCKSNYHTITAMTATLSLLYGSDIFVSWHWHIDFWRNKCFLCYEIKIIKVNPQNH